MKPNIYLITSIFLLLLTQTMSAQGLLMAMEADKNCITSTYCVDLLLQSEPGLSHEIGTSAILMNYNPAAMRFNSYTPTQFDPNADCGAVTGSAWEVHQYDAWSHPGDFNLVLYLANDASTCPSIITDQPIQIGTVCFDILQQGGNPGLSIDKDHVSFNSRSNNDGTSQIPLTDFKVINAPQLLACDCPGTGTPCDDQNVYTVDDRYDLYCNCQGIYSDSDQDGILDGIDPCIDLAYEAEEAVYSGPTFRNNEPQFYGVGYLDYANDPSHFIDFTVEIPQDGEYTMNIRYASSTYNRTLSLSIDTSLIDDQFFFPLTSSWADWQEVSINYTFEAGTHTINLAGNGSYGPNIDRITLSICNDCDLSGQMCDDGNPCTIDDVYDANCNCGGRIVDEDGDQVADACDSHVGGAEDLPIEVGLINAVGDTWQTVTLEQSYESMIVVATPLLPDANALPAVTRIKNAAGNSFDLKIQNPGGTFDAEYAVYYVVVEEGIYKEAYDGIKMEAYRATSDITAHSSNWAREARNYQQTYSQPVVIGQVMSENDLEWSVFWASEASDRRNIPSTNDLAAGKHKAEDTPINEIIEEIGIIVIEQGIYEARNKVLEAAVGPRTIRGINNNGHKYDINSSVLKGAVLSANGMRGGNGYWPVLFGPTPVTETKITMIADEDQVADMERNHTREQVAYLAFEEIICLEDADNDLVCDNEDMCPGFDDKIDSDEDGIPDGCDDCDNRLVGHPCDDGIECTILDVYTPDCGCAGIPFDSDNDGVCNWEDICDGGDDNLDVDNDGIPDDCDPNIGDASTMPIETGYITDVGDSWQTVNLSHSFTSMVVVATVQLDNNSMAPVVARVRNAAGNSFELKVQNPSNLTSDLYDVYYMVVEEGVYRDAYDGVTMEARKINSSATTGMGNHNREQRDYLQAYNKPVVLGQVMTENDTLWSVFWSSLSNSSGTPASATSLAAGKHIGADTITNRANETLGMIVIDSGAYTLRGIHLEAKVGDNTILGVGNNGNTGFQYPINMTNANGAILSTAGMNGGDTHWPVLFSETPFLDTAFVLSVDEDQITDSERAHTTEEVAYIVFDNSQAIPFSLEDNEGEAFSNNQEVANPTPEIIAPANRSSNLLLYPNPAYNQLTLEAEVVQNGERRIVITDISGKPFLAQVLLRDDNIFIKHELDISQLPTGTYFLQLWIGNERQVEPFVIAR